VDVPWEDGKIDLADQLVKLTKKGPLHEFELLKKLDITPSKLNEILVECKARRLAVQVENGHIGFRPEPEAEDVRAVIAPTIGQHQKVAVISDTHLGSKYCLRDYLQDFVHYAYDNGVREILHPGDILDGMYKHGIWELSHHGIDEQTQDLFETLPELPGLTYHGITGNHDHTFTMGNGIEVGPYIEGYFAKRGRNDFFIYGNRGGAHLKVKGVRVHLWHPRSGGAYALSYPLQKKIEGYAPGNKPQILLAGHWHSYVSLSRRGMYAFACPTFQGGGSEFSKSLTTDPSIGGLLLEWDLTADGTIRNFRHEYRSYFEKEVPQELREASVG
jgi:predicted phosphodiesterase